MSLALKSEDLRDGYVWMFDYWSHKVSNLTIF